MVLASAITHIEDFRLICACICLHARPLDFGSGHVQFHVVTELEKLACLYSQGVSDAEEFRMAKRRFAQA